MQKKAYETNNQENQATQAQELIPDINMTFDEALVKLRGFILGHISLEEATTILEAFKAHLKHAWAIILAGGRGSRLPIAGSIPKQFAPKFQNRTFIQDITYAISKAIKPSHIIVVVTNEEQKEYAVKQLTPYGVPSTNVVTFDPHWGYVAVMAMACHYILELDPKATVFISPSDQHINGVENFAIDVVNSIVQAEEGNNVLLGVKVADANIVGGCGNAVYDHDAKGPVYEILRFVEKPLKKGGIEAVRQLLLDDNSVVNTGFYALKAKNLAFAYPKEELEAKLKAFYEEGSEATDLGINPEGMMDKLEMKLMIGGFGWLDCGTLEAYYGIQRKTPNHHNASIGEVTRYECLDSLFVSSTEGIHLYANYIQGGLAVIAFVNKNGDLDIAVIAMSQSQEVGKVTDFFEKGTRVSYSYNAENCCVVPSNISKNTRVAFLGVQNIFVFANRLDNGDINVNVSANGSCVYEKD